MKYFVTNKLQSLPSGHIKICKIKDFETNDSNVIDIQVNDDSIYSDIIYNGELGLGRGYVNNKWTSSNLEKLLTILCKNIYYFQKELTLWNFWSYYLLKSKTINNDKKYIQHHYDVGNDFYQSFLDNNYAAYSVGFYNKFNDKLEDAIQNKIDYIISKLDITPGDIVLDVGCGWGKIAKYIQQRNKCFVHGITISNAQIKYINETVQGIKVFNKDYREIDKLPIMYDRIYSIEMLEHVGYKNYKEYFKQISSILKPNGKFVIQITVSLREGDDDNCQSQYILTDVYPGGQIPKISKVLEGIKNISDLRVHEMQLIDGSHFANTFREWNKRMLTNSSKFDPQLIKSYEYYFNSCIGLFQNNILATCVLVLEKCS